MTLNLFISNVLTRKRNFLFDKTETHIYIYIKKDDFLTRPLKHLNCGNQLKDCFQFSKNVLKDFVAKRLEMLIHFSSEPEAPILLTNGCRNIFPSWKPFCVVLKIARNVEPFFSHYNISTISPSNFENIAKWVPQDN